MEENLQEMGLSHKWILKNCLVFLQLKMNVQTFPEPKYIFFSQVTTLNVCQFSALAVKPKWYMKRILRKLHLIQNFC